MRHSANGFTRRTLRAMMLGALCGMLAPTVQAQEPPGRTAEAPAATASEGEQPGSAPSKVDVKPVARDEEIRVRLQKVLDATGWFTDPEVRVEEGVVFLNGPAKTTDLKEWAGDLARNTQDVVAVANGMEVLEPRIWDLRPAWSGLSVLWRDFIRALPFFLFGLLILVLAVVGSALATRGTRALLHRRISANLLRSVIARGVGALVFLFGVYIVLRVSGLTQLALTVIGGTGLIGLAVGIAFRDITENFLASIFLSMQRPFDPGDLIEVAGVMGYVQQLNVRTTILMALNGSVIEIPNASVYKSNLRNFTANPNRRDDFVVGVGYEDSINEAQETALEVLLDHPAVLKNPEPSVLVDDLGRATINLRVYFWINGREHSWLKVRSSLIRLVKVAFQKQGISMPDEAREVVFPKGVPVALREAKPHEADGAAMREAAPVAEPPEAADAPSTKAEGGLSSEAGAIEEQARQVQPLREEENLLKAAPGARSTDRAKRSARKPPQ